MTAWIALVAGALFGAGACISGMVRASKVLGFLDLRSSWDPSLALVMVTALALQVIVWRVVARMRAPVFGGRFPGPPAKTIDRSLVVGAGLFGLGWGLVGYCSGPAVVSIVSGARASLVFVAAMVAGIWLCDLIKPRH